MKEMKLYFKFLYLKISNSKEEACNYKIISNEISTQGKSMIFFSSSIIYKLIKL